MTQHHIIQNSELLQVDGIWVLIYEGREYLRLLDATSRDDAEQQIAEMLFLRGTAHPAVKTESTPEFGKGTGSPAVTTDAQTSV